MIRGRLRAASRRFCYTLRDSASDLRVAAHSTWIASCFPARPVVQDVRRSGIEVDPEGGDPLVGRGNRLRASSRSSTRAKGSCWPTCGEPCHPCGRPRCGRRRRPSDGCENTPAPAVPSHEWRHALGDLHQLVQVQSHGLSCAASCLSSSRRRGMASLRGSEASAVIKSESHARAIASSGRS